MYRTCFVSEGLPDKAQDTERGAAGGGKHIPRGQCLGEAEANESPAKEAASQKKTRSHPIKDERDYPRAQKSAEQFEELGKQTISKGTRVMKKEEKYDVPDLPVLSGERRELTGFQRTLSDLGLSRMERKGRKEQRKILVETETQLLRDRTFEIINAYRIKVTAAREVIIKATQEYVQAAVEAADRRIADNKLVAMQQAADDYTEFVLSIRSDMPAEVKEALIDNATQVFTGTLEKIRTFELDIDGKVESNYPARRGGFKKFINK